MPQSMLAFLAMAMAIMLALSQYRSEINTVQAMVDDEYEVMANAVALEQIEIIAAQTDWDNLEVWNDSVTTRTFGFNDFQETFDLGVSIQYVDSNGKAKVAPTTTKEIMVAAMNDRSKRPLVTHARLVSK